MKKQIGILAVFALIGGAIGMYMYNKPHKAMENMESTASLTSLEIIRAYQENEQLANEQFLGEVVTVNGVVQAVEKNDGLTLILEGTDLMTTIRCQLDHLTDHPAFAGLNPGDEVAVKGICTGFLMDVVLERCIIQDTKSI